MPRSVDSDRQLQLVWDEMSDGAWHTLTELSELTGQPEASVSARLRDFRKPHFGKNVVMVRRKGSIYEYRLRISGSTELPVTFDYSQVIKTLEKILKQNAKAGNEPQEFDTFRQWKNERLSLVEASKEEVLEAQNRLQPFVLDLNTREHYGDGRELHYCHATGAALMANGEYRDLRHGDGLFMEATINNLQTNFNSRLFGKTRLEVKMGGIVLVMDDDAAISESTRAKWNKTIVVKPDYSVQVARNTNVGIAYVPLYGLLTNSVHVQSLLIKYQQEIKDILLQRALKNRPVMTATAGS